jgi:peptide/nickel transport system ATP-binding protein
MTTIDAPAPTRTPNLLEVSHLEQRFTLSADEVVHAVSDVSFSVARGETFGLVGESGCGKSTTMRAVLQAPPPTSGSVSFDGVELTTLSAGELRAFRRRMQLVFQDPQASLNPRWTVRTTLLEPLQVHHVGDRESRLARVEELMDLVGLDPSLYADRRPGELSGGQCQRVGIARALALAPELIVFDEAVSALDVSIQAQILNLHEELKRKLGLTSVFIAHDLAVVKHVSDRVGVMYLGKLCEVAPATQLYRDAVHPYSQALLSAIPLPDPDHASRGRQLRLQGDVPSPTDPPSGCRFRTRCPRAQELCAQVEPSMRSFGLDHTAACHFPSRSPVDAVDATTVATTNAIDTTSAI